MKRSWIMLAGSRPRRSAPGGQAWAFWATVLVAHYSWHGEYYDAAWGMPVALVVPTRLPHAGQLELGRSQFPPDLHSCPVHARLDGTGLLRPQRLRAHSALAQRHYAFGVYYVRGPR